MRYWSVVFGLAAVFAVACFVYSPFSADWWVPLAGTPPHVISTFDAEIQPVGIERRLPGLFQSYRHGYPPTVLYSVPEGCPTARAVPAPF